jgi:hypothetical protein
MSFYPRCLEDTFVDDDISLVSFVSSFGDSESYCISSSVSVLALASCDVNDFLFDVAMIVDYITYKLLILNHVLVNIYILRYNGEKKNE